MKPTQGRVAPRLALFLALLLALTACGPKAPGPSPSPSESPSASPSASPTPTPVPSGAPFHLSVGHTREVSALDPAQASSDEEVTVLSHVFEGLLRWAPGTTAGEDGLYPLELAPGQAQSYAFSADEDGKAVCTFTLREDARWSDGKQVTAGDFLYAWRRLADPATQADRADLLEDVQGYEDVRAGKAEPDTLGVEAPDARTLVVRLDLAEGQDEGGLNRFLENCAHPAAAPVRQDLVEADEAATATPSPSPSPSEAPGAAPGESPSVSPEPTASDLPSEAPTETPPAPAESPTDAPASPSGTPDAPTSETPSEAPSASGGDVTSEAPTESPSESPSPSPSPTTFVAWWASPAKFVGNGPYTLSAWTRFGSMVLVRNAHYYGEPGGPDTLTFRYYYDEAAVLSAYEAGTVDVAPQVSAGTEKARSAPYAGAYFLTYNTTVAPFDDPRVREAFALAVDREEIGALMGGEAAGGLVPPGIPDAAGADGDFRSIGGDYFLQSERDDADENYAANCQRAQELLAQAGYPGGKGFPTVRYAYNTGARHQEVAKALVRMWRKVLGVNVAINGVGWSDYLDALQGDDYALAKLSWTAQRNDPADFLELWAGGMKWYKSEAYDDLMAQAGGADSRDGRMDLLHRAEDLLVGEDWAVCPLYTYRRAYLAAEEVAGLAWSPLGQFCYVAAHRK